MDTPTGSCSLTRSAENGNRRATTKLPYPSRAVKRNSDRLALGMVRASCQPFYLGTDDTKVSLVSFTEAPIA